MKKISGIEKDKTLDVEKLAFKKISDITPRIVNKHYSLKRVLSLFK